MFIAIIIYILWIIGYAYYNYNQEKNRLYTSLDQQLETAAHTAILLLPESLHQQSMQKEALSLQLDAQNMQVLSKYTDNNNVVYIYTLIEKENKIFFTSSSATQAERSSGEYTASYLDLYDDVAPEVFEIFKHPQKTFLEYNDQWGHFRSVFIPHYSEDGRLYLAAADLSTETIQKILRDNLYRTLLFSFLFILFVYPIYFVTTRYIKQKSLDLEKQVNTQSLALTKNQQRLAHASLTAKQTWFEIDLVSKIIHISEDAREILRVNKEKPITIDFWERSIHPEDRLRTMDAFQHCIETETPVFVEYRHRTRERGWGWIYAVVEVINWDNNKKPQLLGGINMDITERKRNEQILKTLAETSNQADGNIFRTITRQIAQSHNANYVYIATVNKDKTKTTTLAFWVKNTFITNVCEELKSTPCNEALSKQEIVFYESNVQEAFPECELLVDLDAQSYLGVSFKNSQGEVTGCIALLNDRPMRKTQQTTDLLKSLSVRVAMELEQQNNIKELHVFAQMFHNTHESIILVDNNEKISYANPATYILTGYSKGALIGESPTILRAKRLPTSYYDDILETVVNEGGWKGEAWIHCKNSDDVEVSLTISKVFDDDGQQTHRMILAADITDHKRQQYALEVMAHYDPLTKLPNRLLFSDRFKQALAHSKQSKTLLAICFLDLDNFKPINDNYGHEVGDQILIEVSRRISDNIQPTDTISRQGGDEFTLLISAMDSFRKCERVLTDLLQVITEPYIIKGETHYVSVSIGVTLSPLDNSDIDTLLRHADQAMYQAKELGKNQYRLFNVLENEESGRDDIRTALLSDQLHLHYQPKVNMKTGNIFGAEALIRWQPPQGDMLFPCDFLPAIGNTELEKEVGDWVIKTALSQLRIWIKQGLKLEISINISSNHLLSVTFVSRLEQHLAAHPEVDSQLLQLEILESSALGDIKIISNIIKTCKNKLGVRIALDDFGTGYSSLTHMRNLPAEVIKIDHSFVRNLLEDPNDFAIINGILGLSIAFGRDVIAEGVETSEHGLMLIIMGCSKAQGYGVARPMPAVELPLWVKSYTPNQAWIELSARILSTEEKKLNMLMLVINNLRSKFDAFTNEKQVNDAPNIQNLNAWNEQMMLNDFFENDWLTRLELSQEKLFSAGEAVIKEHELAQKEETQQKLTTLHAVFDDVAIMLNTAEKLR